MATQIREPHQIEVMKDQFLLCRTERHMWDMVGDRSVATNSRGYVIKFTRHTKCLRCGSEKFQTFILPGFVRPHAPRIIYSKGYLSRSGRIMADDVRGEQLSRSGLKIATSSVKKRSDEQAQAASS